MGQTGPRPTKNDHCKTCGVLGKNIKDRDQCRPCKTALDQSKKIGLAPHHWHEARWEVCEICGASEKLCVDHDHETGKFRGYLCGKCNKALGLFRDDLGLLEKAKVYLGNFRG